MFAVRVVDCPGCGATVPVCVTAAALADRLQALGVAADVADHVRGQTSGMARVDLSGMFDVPVVDGRSGSWLCPGCGATWPVVDGDQAGDGDQISQQRPS